MGVLFPQGRGVCVSGGGGLDQPETNTGQGEPRGPSRWRRPLECLFLVVVLIRSRRLKRFLLAQLSVFVKAKLSLKMGTDQHRVTPVGTGDRPPSIAGSSQLLPQTGSLEPWYMGKREGRKRDSSKGGNALIHSFSKHLSFSHMSCFFWSI